GSVPHGDVTCDLVCDMARGSNAHQPQVLLHLVVAHDFQKGRLLQLDGQPLAQGAVKHGVACRVDEVGEDKRVLVGKFCGPESWCALKIEVTCHEQHQDNRGSRNNCLPASCDTRCGRGLRTRYH